MVSTISRREAVRAALASAAGVALPTVAVAEASAVDVPSLPEGFLGGFVSFYHHPTGWHHLRIDDEPDAATDPDVHTAAVALIAALFAAADTPLAEDAR